MCGGLRPPLGFVFLDFLWPDTNLEMWSPVMYTNTQLILINHTILVGNFMSIIISTEIRLTRLLSQTRRNVQNFRKLAQLKIPKNREELRTICEASDEDPYYYYDNNLGSNRKFD